MIGPNRFPPENGKLFSKIEVTDSGQTKHTRETNLPGVECSGERGGMAGRFGKARRRLRGYIGVVGRAR
jgi:hypothetical protein